MIELRRGDADAADEGGEAGVGAEGVESGVGVEANDVESRVSRWTFPST